MSEDGLLIGEVAKRTGATRKALRLYEEAGTHATLVAKIQRLLRRAA